MNKTELKAQIRIEALVKDAEKALSDFRSSFESVWSNSEPPKGLLKKWEGLKYQMASLREIAQKDFVNKADLDQANSNYKAISKTVHNLSIEFKTFSDEQKKALLGSEEQKAMAARTAALEAYNKAMEKSGEIAAKREKLLGEKNDLNRQKAQQETLRTGYQDRLNKIKNNQTFDMDKVKQYQDSQKEIIKLNKKIEKTKKAIESSIGMNPEGDNKLTRAKKELADLEGKYKSIDQTVGKIDFEAWERHNAIVEELETGIKESTEAITEYGQKITTIDQNLAELKTPTQEFNNLKESLKKLGVAGIENAENIDQVKEVLKEFDDEALEKVSQALRKTEKYLDNFGKEAASIKKEIDKGTDSIERQNQALRDQEAFESRIKQFLGMAGATEILRRSLQNAFETTKQLDEAMTQMAVVTDLEVGDYWNQLPEHTKRASELGIAIKDVYEAETLYYQQGLKTNEVVAISTETLKMARIAGLSAEDATNKMTAALRGFNMELNETSAQKVADVYSELAAITASDVKEISSAMTKTASIASSAGMEFETTAAFLSQIIETTRESAETAGTAMKTVIARFQELKKSPSEIGEVEGEIVDANAIETALRSVGVALRDSNGQFRDLDDVFLELSSKWAGLDKNTQRYIATIAAGSRQQSRFIAMMSDYGRTQELVSAANNSAGASQKQYEKTLESLKSKLAELKNAWDEFSMGILESDLVKFGVDILTKFLEIINKATSAFNGLGGSITKVLSTIALFKLGQKIFDGIKKPMAAFFTNLVRDVYTEGKKAGEAFVEGMKDSQKSEKQKEEETAREKEKKELTEEEKKKLLPKTIKERISDTIGFDGKKYEEAKKQKAEAKEQLENLKKQGGLNKRTNEYKKEYTKLQKIKKTDGEESEAYKTQEKAVKNAEASLIEYKQTQQEVGEAAKTQWEVVGESFKNVGAAVSGLGVGISMLGGILSSVGLEEAGEVVAGIGNGVTVIGSAISFIGTALTAIPPILAVISAHPIIAIITGICALIIGTIAIIAKIKKDTSISAKMERAAEATEKAKEAAEEAKTAYDDMVSDREGFEEMQKQLAGLTRGTKEWREALRKSNEEVLNLITTYPKLAKYLTRGEQGELIIADAGWDELIASQEKAMHNAQSEAITKQLDQLKLQELNAKKTIKNTEKLRIELEKISEEAENISKASLTTMASQEFLDDDFGKSIIAAFANSLNSDAMDKAIQDKINESTYADSSGGIAGEETFTSLARQYGVEGELVKGQSNDLANAQKLYKAMFGTDAPKDMKLNELLEAIYSVDEKEILNKKMEDYGERIRNLNNRDIINIAGLLSGEEGAMTKTYAQHFLKTDGTFNTKAVEEVAGQIYSGEEFANLTNEEKVQKWAGDVGKTVEELYATIEDSVREVITISDSTYGRLSKSLGREVEKIGPQGSITLNNRKNLSNQIADISSLVGKEEANLLLSQLEEVLLSTKSKNADAVAGAIGNMNWSSPEEWSELQKILKNMGIVFNDNGKALEDFIKKAQELGIAVETVNLQTLASEIQSMYDTIERMKTGEQGRVFGKETYDQLIAANADLTDQFVQIGEEFHYIGGAVEELARVFQMETAHQMEIAKVQLEANQKAAQAAQNFGTNFGGKMLKLDKDNYTKWSKEEKIAYLEAYRQKAVEEGVDTLQYITGKDGKSLGINLGTNFQEISEEKMNAFLYGLSESVDNLEHFDEEIAKMGKDAAIARRTLISYSQNLEDIEAARAEGKRDTYAEKAFSIQASESGQVADAVISKYNELIAQQDDANLETIRDLEETMRKGLERANKNIESIKNYNTTASQIVDALYDIGQAQIDELSKVNDSINEANEKLVNKIQEQINDARQERENQRAEQDITDKETRLAYLMRDTSGANDLEILALQKEIADAKESYTDTLVDQSLENLQDANEQAAEQRERQIEIMQAQLDYAKESGELTREAENLLNEGIAQIRDGVDPLDSEVAKILIQAKELAGDLTEEQKAEIFDDIAATLLGTANAVGGEGSDEATIASIGEDIKDYLYGNKEKGITGIYEKEETAAKEASEAQKTRERSIGNAKIALSQGSTTSSKDYTDAKSEYMNNGGTEDQWRAAMQASGAEAEIKNSSMLYQATGWHDDPLGSWDEGISVTIGGQSFENLMAYAPDSWNGKGLADTSKDLGNKGMAMALGISENDTPIGSVALYNGDPYILQNRNGKGRIWTKLHTSTSQVASNVASAMKKQVAFKTGGLADFTGPAWLDGTKSKPEIVLNQQDSANFLVLRDILSEILHGSTITNNSTKNNSGDNYFDIDISVESIGEDYDVEQLANKIRSMIYDDSMYRNVNTVNLIR